MTSQAGGEGVNHSIIHHSVKRVARFVIRRGWAEGWHDMDSPISCRKRGLVGESD